MKAIPLGKDAETSQGALGINWGTVQKVNDSAPPLLVSLLTRSSGDIQKRAEANGAPLNRS